VNIINTRTRPFIVIAGGVVALLAIVNLAPAGEPRPRFRNVPIVDQTRIVVDQNAKVIRFYVEGQQVALIDSRGFNH
jgi:hypothetical protein